MIRIGFFPLGSTVWYGGVTYLENLLYALRLIDKEELSTTVFFEESSSYKYTSKIKNYASTFVIYDPKSYLKRWTLKWVRYQIYKRIFHTFQDSIMKGLLSENSIDVIFNTYGLQFRQPLKTPRIGWITDFQHIHLPEFSTEKLVRERDEAIRITAENATKIVVSSKDALNDLKQFAPEFLHKAHVLHFVAQIPPWIYESDPQDICNMYNLPNKFVYLPNQFWKHKNHKTAFDAIRILKLRGIKLTLVCTGNTRDFRDELYFPKILEYISKLDIHNQVVILGLIPHDYIYMLMRQSICVLNPSFFEGWSTTVEEAKTLGKSVVLSNINVHIEQNPPEGKYFDPNNPKELADILEEVYMSKNAGPDKDLETVAKSTIDRRNQEFAKTFLKIARLAIKDKR